MEVELAAPGAGRSEKYPIVPGVLGVHRAGVSVAVRVQHGVRVGFRDRHGNAALGLRDRPSDADPRPSAHFAQRILDTAAVCFDSLLQQGIRILTFGEVVSILRAWHGPKDCAVNATNASDRPSQTGHGVIVKFVDRAMAVAFASFSVDPPEFPFPLYIARRTWKAEARVAGNCRIKQGKRIDVFEI